MALLQSFKKGLTEHLQKRVNKLDPGPTTLNEYIAAAVHTQTKENQEKIENVLWRRRTAPHFPWSRILSTGYEEQSTSPSLTYVGDTTMFG